MTTTNDLHDAGTDRLARAIDAHEPEQPDAKASADATKNEAATKAATSKRDWRNTDAGPIQIKRVNAASRDLFCLDREMREMNHEARIEDPATIKPFRHMVLVGAYGIMRERCWAEHTRIGERFGWTLTKGNAALVAADYKAAHASLHPQVPFQIPFVVASVSLNTNAFGGRGHILIARCGLAFEAIRVDGPGRPDLRQGRRLTLYVTHDFNRIIGAQNGALESVEIITRIANRSAEACERAFALPIPDKDAAAA